jgi:hypothetical protein
LLAVSDKWKRFDSWVKQDHLNFFAVQCWLLLLALILSGICEVKDNILHWWRVENFDSSAPVIFKVTKELIVLSIMLGMLRCRNDWRQKFTPHHLCVFAIFLFCAVCALFARPLSITEVLGIVYLLSSAAVLFVLCLVYPIAYKQVFIRNFLLPALGLIVFTQLLEAIFAPYSIWSDPTMFGFDRRAGLAVIPTTAGLLGVAGVLSLKDGRRLFGLAAMLIANSSISFVILAMMWIKRVRYSRYALYFVAVIVVVMVLVVLSRQFLMVSIEARLHILADSLPNLTWFGPSEYGAKATAKYVAISPYDAYIVDSFYLEILNVFGIIPGCMFIAMLFAVIYRYAGVTVLAIFALAGIGYLVLEAWLVWITLIFSLSNGGQTWAD